MDDYGSISDEAMPAASGTYVGEATRALIVVVARHAQKLFDQMAISDGTRFKTNSAAIAR